MNQLKHTPGEWKADIEDDGLQMILVTAGDEVIAEVHGDPRPVSDTEDCTEEGIANGKLIAAAPDLLVALQDAIGIVQAVIVNARHRYEVPSIIEGLERRESSMRAAIAKATGQ